MPLLAHQRGTDETTEVKGQRRGWNVQSRLDLADHKAIVTSGYEKTQYIESCTITEFGKDSGGEIGVHSRPLDHPTQPCNQFFSPIAVKRECGPAGRKFRPNALVILPGPLAPLKLPARALLPLPYRR